MNCVHCSAFEGTKLQQQQQQQTNSPNTLSSSKKMLQCSREHSNDGIFSKQSFFLPTLFSPTRKTNDVRLRLSAAFDIASRRQLLDIFPQFVDILLVASFLLYFPMICTFELAKTNQITEENTQFNLYCTLRMFGRTAKRLFGIICVRTVTDERRKKNKKKKSKTQCAFRVYGTNEK